MEDRRDNVPYMYFSDIEQASRTIDNLGANYRDRYGSTPLHYAAYFGNYDIARLLLDRGADTNIVDMFYITPINEAIKRARFNIMDLLIEYAEKQHGS